MGNSRKGLVFNFRLTREQALWLEKGKNLEGAVKVIDPNGNSLGRKYIILRAARPISGDAYISHMPSAYPFREAIECNIALGQSVLDDLRIVGENGQSRASVKAISGGGYSIVSVVVKGRQAKAA